MKILVIGGTRFIGLAAVRRLVELGHEVTVFNRGKTLTELPAGVRHIMGDRDNLRDQHEALQTLSPDVVWHNVIVNEGHARDLIDVFRGVAGRAVMVSSMDVYLPYNYLFGIEKGDPVQYPMTEESPLRSELYPYRAFVQDQNDFRWTYDKIPAERLILNDFQLPGTVLRLPMVYGENDFQRRLTPFLKPMLDDRPAVVMGESEAAWRSTYGYVENVAEAIIHAILDDRAAGRVYNVGEITPSALELAQMVKEAVGWKGEFVTVPDSELPETLRGTYDYSAHLASSDARIRQELGFAPPIPTDTAVRRTVVWEERNLDPNINYAETLNYAAQDEVLARRSGV